MLKDVYLKKLVVFIKYGLVAAIIEIVSFPVFMIFVNGTKKQIQIYFLILAT